MRGRDHGEMAVTFSVKSVFMLASNGDGILAGQSRDVEYVQSKCAGVPG